MMLVTKGRGESRGFVKYSPAWWLRWKPSPTSSVTTTCSF